MCIAISYQSYYFTFLFYLPIKKDINRLAYDSFGDSLLLFSCSSIGLFAHLASPISPSLSLLYECHRIGKVCDIYIHSNVDCLRNDLTGLILSQAFINDYSEEQKVMEEEKEKYKSVNLKKSPSSLSCSFFYQRQSFD